MIIRRRHTSHFTTIGNVLFDDERLQADEVGIIAYLLSKPHDWEVRRPQLAKRFHYGRDAIKRVLWNAMRSGWIVAKKTQLENGRFFTIYEVRDVPGPMLSDDEIRAALSLGSSDAGEDAEASAEHTDTGDPPPTGDPGVGEPATGNPYVDSKEESTKYGFKKDEPTKGARAFADVKAKWPADHILSAATCEQLHAGLTDDDRQKAFEGVTPYLADCHAKTRKVCDLATYYREKRWQRFADGAQPKATSFAIKPYTAQWHRWRDYRIATGQSIKFMEMRAASGQAWTEMSEWPPAMPKADEQQKAG